MVEVIVSDQGWVAYFAFDLQTVCRMFTEVEHIK